MFAGCATSSTASVKKEEPAAVLSGDGLPGAKALLDEGNIAAAIALAEQHTQDQPEDDAGFYTLGTLLSATGDWESAMSALEGCIALNPRHGAAHNNLGLIRLARRDLEPALVALDRATQLLPDDSAPWVNLAAVHTARGAYGRAAEALEEAVGRAPDESQIRLELAGALARAGQRGQALATYRSLDGLLTATQTVERALGEATVLRQMGRHEEARARADEAMKAAPTDELVLIAAALARDVTGDDAGAEKLYKRALEADPAALDALYNYGSFLEERGRKGEAKALFERYLKLNTQPSARRGHVLGRLKRLTPVPGGTASPPDPEEPKNP